MSLPACAAAATVAGAAALTAGVGAFAHHSVAGQFDISQPTTWEGVITKIDWINPR